MSAGGDRVGARRAVGTGEVEPRGTEEGDKAPARLNIIRAVAIQRRIESPAKLKRLTRLYR
eukprot:59848-Hanusia_phi.AAC.6